MISLGRRDARKELGLGFGEMEDTELEEGEACSDHNVMNNNSDDGYDASIDPDIALSYLDAKLQNVLGHFQKDFEGGVSAENLGAKFGGYGSFLPTYQRSPVWSHPKTPQKIQNYNAPRSPNNIQLEGTRCGLVSSSTASQSVKREPASVSKASSSPFLAVRQEAGMQSSDLAKENALRYEPPSRKFTNLPDQKLLKVRIKMGSDNLSTQKNVAIYSGLGLVMSPSSSLDDSPSGSEGMSHGLQDSPYESPAHILQIMTSFPVRGGKMLSPLADDLIHLTERAKFHKGRTSFPVLTVGSGNSGSLLNGSLKGDGKLLGEKRVKSLERNEKIAEPKCENGKDSHSVDALPKEVDMDTSACEDLVSNTLKLPLVLDSYSAGAAANIFRSSNISREVSNGVVRDKSFSDQSKEPVWPISTNEDIWVENPKGNSAGKIWEDEKASSLDSVPFYSRKDAHARVEKPSIKSDSNVSKGMKSLSSELTDMINLKADHKFTSSEQEGIKLPFGKERSSYDGKKKLKGSQNQVNIAADVPKDGLISGSSLVVKNKKSTPSDENINRREVEDLKSQKNTGKVGDKYADFFGDELDQEENQTSPLEMRYTHGQKESDLGEKNTCFFNNAPKERSSSKKNDKLLTSEMHPRTAPPVTPFPGNGTLSDVTPAATAPAATEDLWVCCDKCQKWRLLPLGKNPHDLPDKWICSMLNWLPGMNRCILSEDETTHAAMVLNQAPLASQSNMPTNPGGVVPRITMAGDQLDYNHQNLGLHPISSGGKKKTSNDGTTLLSNSMKKSIPASVINNGNLIEVNQPLVSEPGFPKQTKTSDLTVEKHKHKQKEKHKVLDNGSDGGDTRQSKMKARRHLEEDLFRESKKTRNEGLSEDWVSDNSNIEKVGPSSSHGFPTNSSGMKLPKSNGRMSSKDQVLSRKSKDRVPMSLDDMPSDMGKRDDREGGKKRKLKASYDTEVNTGPILNSGHNLQDSSIVAKEEFSDNEYRKQKKARVSRSDGKESSASKGCGKTERKGSHRKNQQQLGKNMGSSLSLRGMDGVDFSKRDSGSLHPSVAATSSSSKVSGSHKTKASFHETKGSPVESVSSSPLRVSKQGKLASGQRKFTEKDDSGDAGFLAQRGRPRCSDVEDDGGSDRSGTGKKENCLEVARHGSHESSLLDFQEKDFGRVSNGKAKQQIVPSPDIKRNMLANGSSEYIEQATRCSSKTTTLARSRDDARQHENHYHMNGSRPKKSGKGSSSRSKDKKINFTSEFDDGNIKVSKSITELAPSLEVKPTDVKIKMEDKFGVRSDESENRHVDKKDSAGLFGETSKKENQSKSRGHGVSDSKVHPMCSRDATSTPKQNMLLASEIASRRGKSPSLPPSGGAQNETAPYSPQLVSGSHKENGANVAVSNASVGDNSLKTLKQIKNVDYPNGTHHSSSRDSNGRRTKDLDAPSPAKRESSSQGAMNALREAKSLKHLADRYKSTGPFQERTKFYFEAALKFLHAASLLETCSSENLKSGEMIMSMEVYSSTGKLCEFCAHEYEKSKDMAAAALAYKCMEVAYMRVIYSSHNIAFKDRHELQTALNMVPPGESPSSSASDIDNLNHPATVDKGILTKSISSPQVTGSHIITARHRPNYVRLLNYAQDVNYAMEASRKSRSAFAAANISLGESQNTDGISSVKTALDFNFQDVEGLLRLVRLAIEAISPPNS
ncbi:cysteine-tryptophan domain-containing zinc finger protein 7-like [Mercurialis annua]|uniref:cysteine-tryptophan domain-containing zinc finger protein 7-like n=1 Tax=Mercurialis annua TaxID=3986 RepID=UPI00215F7A6F|nr:cysteine-tryptophan domain-containing zinc finger protein 7-like [Mercurialis annua]